MLPEPVARFRAAYHEHDFPAHHSDVLNRWITFGGGAAACIACLAQLDGVTRAEWLTVPVAFLDAKLGEHLAWPLLATATTTIRRIVGRLPETRIRLRGSLFRGSLVKVHRARLGCGHEAAPKPAMATSARYPRALIALHWLTLLLLVAVYCMMELRGAFPRGSEPRELMKMLHYSFGLTVLLLLLPRIVLRLRGPIPPVAPPLSTPLRVSAAAGHLALYLFMLGMPLGGWLLLSAEGATISFYGLTVPPLVAPDKALAHLVEDLHETGATVGYFLVGLHAAAALYHHLVRRDDTLRRMLPG
jgi:cytochrome b561